MRIGVGFLCLILLASCGKKSQVSLKFDDSVTSEQRKLFEGDLAVLDTLSPTTSRDTKLMDISDFSAPTLAAWLTHRAKAIVGPTYNLDRNIGVLRTAVPYLPRPVAIELENRGEGKIMMANLGAAVYMAGKKEKWVLGMKVAGDTLTVTSPRVGVFQVHELFKLKVLGAPADAKVNSLVRLSILFHEARHSDGNGEATGLPHAICASGDYQGQPACERYAQGPYVVSRITTERFLEACSDCTSGEKEALTLMIADYQSRLLPNPEEVDTRAEGIDL